MSTPTAVAGYPSKLDAAIGLAAKGLKAKDIAARIGSTEGSVYEMLRKHRKQACGGQPKSAKPKTSKPEAAPQPGIWTQEKIDKARRLFGKTMIYIAEALQVPADELLHYALDGEIPPMGKAQRIGMLRNRISAPPSGPGQPGGDPGPTGLSKEQEPSAPLLLAAPALNSDAPDEPDVVDAAGGNSAAPAPNSPETASPLPRAEMPMAATVQQRFRLRDETGQYLHEHERGMTRIAKFYWRGTEAQIASLMRKKPHLRHLEREECL